MNICIPVTEDQGLSSPVSAHFGSAPLFLLVDTETLACRTLSNKNLNHAHGMCQPLMSLAGEPIDGILVGGIGRGAVMKLQAAGIRVFFAEHPTVKEALTAYQAGSLREVTLEGACGHHGGSGGCGH